MNDEKVTGIRLHSGEEFESHAVVVAVGGKAVPQTGSTGDGYPWAEKAGHTVTDLYPTEVPLLSNEPFIKSRDLQGLALRDVAVTVLNKKQSARHAPDGYAVHPFRLERACHPALQPIRRQGNEEKRWPSCHRPHQFHAG
ncbi:hypothetical protein CW734_07690 [Planococcus sp. MB-3u-03]|nr:hypothetical protein CW734_07690 [Planococcus sp. MB-3u-03]